MPYRELGTPDALKAALNGVDQIIIDATEHADHRSADDANQREHYSGKKNRVVLENSNVAKLASTQYLSVHSLPQEDRYDTDDASAREIYSILVPESTMCPVQSSRRRQHRASVVDRETQAHRTAALYGMRPGIL